MRRWVIIGGAEIRDYKLMRKYLRHDDYYVYCDCGLRHQEKLGAVPDLIIGDFDSHERPEDLSNVIVLPVEKDDTDTIYAVKEGMERGYDDFLMIGATGGRHDMTLGNIYALLMLAKSGKNALMVDDCSEMKIITPGQVQKVRYGWRCFSLLNIAGTARGITITGAKYCLDDAEIVPEYQYGISNEVLSPDDDAVITLREGALLLVCVADSKHCR
ncbi:MAG: thiamine diphosphokinase [Synergistaceae bacterium]|nr:thiamine diphosphokinase [Synergistaceae bacterium]